MIFFILRFLLGQLIRGGKHIEIYTRKCKLIFKNTFTYFLKSTFFFNLFIFTVSYLLQIPLFLILFLQCQEIKTNPQFCVLAEFTVWDHEAQAFSQVID